jgi:hypothetical protein
MESVRAQRFWAKVEVDHEGCWLWTAALDSVGYGVFSIGGNRNAKAHRWLYESAFGPIPNGLECDHLCRVRRCVNPNHIELVTHRENIARSNSTPFKVKNDYAAGVCRSGHSLAEFGRTHKDGYVRCSRCAAERRKARASRIGWMGVQR